MSGVKSRLPGSSGPPVKLRFTVDVENLSPNEVVYVTGSIASLGLWEPRNAMLLTKNEEKPTRWHGSVDTCDESVQFRYFIGYKLSADVGERLIVAQWESFLHPRNCLVRAEQRDGEARRQSVDLFGYYGMDEPLDEFGFMKNEFKAGRRLVSEGWLQHDEENQILLRIHGNALKFYKADRKNCRIKCTPTDVRTKQCTPQIPSIGNDEEIDEDDDQSISNNPYPSHSDTVVAVLSNDNSKFNRQSPVGVQFNNGKDYCVFKTHSVAVEFLAFLVEIFSEEGKRIGAGYALPSSLNDTVGHTSLPFINSIGRPIGQITVDYLFVRSLRVPHPCQKMDISFSRHWKKRTTLEVGHRGMGNSYTKFAMTRENTIHSLNAASQNGADFVEFDVQLTKDKIPVIYHDFHVLVSVARRAPSIADLSNIAEEERRGIDYHEMALKDLKLSQLRLLMMDHLQHNEKASIAKKLVGDASENEDLKSFPRLADALQRVDPDVGFNVEVKYPMMQLDGLHECDNYFERNLFVDIILADILNYAGNRRIMFSSFDPDICSLIAMKQNKYPCLFLCIGETQRYTPFQDQRSSTSMTAVNFAAGTDILGVNFNSEDLLKDPRPVKRACELGLVTFVWGDDLDKKEIINYFKKELGVDGIIYDRIGEDERRRNVFIVEREQKKALFKAGSGASTPRARSPDSGTSGLNHSNAPSEKGSSSPPSPPILEESDQSKLQTAISSPRIQIQQS